MPSHTQLPPSSPTDLSMDSAAGFCPCLRCRPELAPTALGLYTWSMQGAGAVLVRQAGQLLGISALST